jgi:hypothetical protein
MTKPEHLGGDRLFDVLEGAGSAAERAHVAACAECAALVAEAGAGQRLAAGAEVPEPSPLYWEAFRRSVGRRIETDRQRTWALRLVPVLATVAAIAFVVPSLRLVSPGLSPVPAAALPAWSPLPPADEDPGLAVLAGLAHSTSELNLAECDGIAECVSQLPDDENGGVLDALRDEMASRRDVL